MPSWAGIGIGVIAAFYAIGAFNRLVTLRMRVRDAWAQIDVQLKRRHDLVPNLVSAVQGYMAHERDVLERVTQARQQALAAGENLQSRIASETALTLATRELLARVEGYPSLKASENMMNLQEELASTENRIAFARQFYNDSVMEYNTACDTFPR